MTQATKSQIPQFTIRAEEAAFWDSRDITDFLAELERLMCSLLKICLRLWPPAPQGLLRFTGQRIVFDFLPWLRVC